MRRAYSKARLCGIVVKLLEAQGAKVTRAGFRGDSNDLPYDLDLTIRGKTPRRYQLFVWTVGHGGRTRSQHEYRIQTKLKKGRQLAVEGGTPLLLGYYDQAVDVVGKDLGNKPAKDMVVFAAWNPVSHLHVGASSSCQVSFALLLQAYLHGAAAINRSLRDGPMETVVAFRPEKMLRYFELADGGHEGVTAPNLLRLT